MQLNYDIEPAIGLPGQIARASEFRDIVTGVIAEEGEAEVADVVFAGVWAPADTATVNVMGIPVVATLIAGDDTITEARDRALLALAASAPANAVATFAAVSTNTIRVTGKEIGSGTGQYFDINVSSSEVTAGSGTAVTTTTQQSVNAGAAEFGMGLALDTTDDRGKRVRVPTGTGFVFAGVVVFTHAVASRDLAGNGAIEPTHPINLLKKGYVYLVCEDGCDPGEAIFLRHTVNGTATPGHFRTDADTARADAITGARWVTGCAAGELAVAFFG